MALTDQLVEFWTLNNTRVGAIGGITLTSYDGADHYGASGKIGQDWDTGGVAGRWLIQPAPLFSPTGPWSYSCWVRCTAVNSSSVRIIWWYPSTRMILRFSETKQPQFVLNNVTVTSTVSIGENVWVHLAIVYDPAAANRLAIYVNSVGTFGGPTVTEPLSATQIYYAGSAPILPGEIDCIGFWTRALEQTDVDALYNSGAGWEYGMPEPAAVYATLRVNDGPLAGQYIILKTG
jgi:hypothetical protein